MQVKDVMKMLSKFEPDDEVLFSCDEEGNVLHAKAHIELTSGFDDENEDREAVVIYPLNTKDDIGL